MPRQSSCAILLLLAIGVALPREVSAAIQISFCGQQNSCVCIDWTGPSSSWIEVRCPQSEDSGWTQDPTGETVNDPDGTWGGPGAEQPSDEPGSPLSGSLLFSWNLAYNVAENRLRGDSNCCLGGKPYYTPNECTMLFNGNPMGRTGKYLLTEYINPRRGDGVVGPKGKVPCDNAGISVWTTCCQHDPDVFVCSRFENQPRDFAAALVIHEVLHVAGQREESDPGEEPLPPPTPAEITDAVREACDL